MTVINETMARKYFPGEEPIGKRILIQEIARKDRARSGDPLGSCGRSEGREGGKRR